MWFPGTRAVWAAIMSAAHWTSLYRIYARLRMLTPASEDVSPASAYPQINGTRVRYCTNRWCRGSLGLWYFILTDRSVAVNFAPMLLIWLTGSIRFWRIDLTSPFFDMSCGTRCRSWWSLGSWEPWPVWGQRDDSDCFYFDCTEIGHSW